VSRELAKRAEKEAERGSILRLVVAIYPLPMKFSGLQQALMIEGKPVDDEALEFHLSYLEESGYVRVEREERRKKKTSRLIYATRKAIDLKDGRGPEDPGIAL